jgi:hypothetical protein
MSEAFRNDSAPSTPISTSIEIMYCRFETAMHDMLSGRTAVPYTAAPNPFACPV